MAETALTIPSNFMQKKEQNTVVDQFGKSFNPVKKDLHEMLVNMTNYTAVRKEVFAKLLVFLDLMLEKMGISVKTQVQSKQMQENGERGRKLQEKINKDTEKHVVKKKWYEKVAGYLKDSLEKPAGFFTQLFKWMLLFALLGPEMAISIVKMIGGLINYLLKIFIGFIPQMVDATIKVIIGLLPVVWGIFKMLATTVFEGIKNSVTKIFSPASSMYDRLKGIVELFLFIGVGFLSLYKILNFVNGFTKIFGINLLKIFGKFFSIAQEGGKSITWFGKVLDFVGNKFLKLGNIFMSVFRYLSLFLTSMGKNILTFFMNLGPKILSFLTNSWNILGKFAQTIIQGVSKFIGIIGNIFRSLFTFLGPIGLIIVGVIILISLIWKFSDSIANWFDNLISWVTKWYNSLGPIMRKIVLGIAAIFWPIIGIVFLLIKAVSSLAKLFNYLKKEGFSGIWDSIKEFFGGLGDRLKSWFVDKITTIFDSLKGVWNTLMDFINGGIAYIWDRIKNPSHIISGGPSFTQSVTESTILRQYDVSKDRLDEIRKTGTADKASPLEIELLANLEKEGINKDTSDEKLYAALEKIAKNTAETKVVTERVDTGAYVKGGKVMNAGGGF